MAETFNPGELADEARRAYDGGDYLEAARLYKAAEQGFDLGADPCLAAEMANNCSVALLQAGEPKAALQALEGREQVFERAGDLKRLGMTWGNRGMALEALKQFDLALQAYHQASDLFKQIGENELYTTTMQSISSLQLRTNRPLEAVASMQAGLGQVRKPGIRQRLLKRLLDLPSHLLNR
jgi:tetratricopeptide (TPR) repeat protein